MIGTAVFILAAQFAPVTGACMNPARDLGPRIITHFAGWGAANLSFGWWAYSAGPVIGAILGGALYNNVLVPQPKSKLQQQIETAL